MDLRHLRYFLAVADEAHFGRAAKQLHIVQPALSMQIRALEEELGTPLFIRTTRQVELTEAGRLLKVEAERTIAQAEHAKAVVQRSARGETGSVRIGFAGNAVFTGRLAHDLHAFHALHPDVELELREMPPLVQGESILAGRLDIGYCPFLDISSDRQLNVEQIGVWPWMIALAGDHPLAKRKYVASKMIRTEPFILYAATGADVGQLTVLRKLLGYEPRVAHLVANTLTVLALASAGLGIGLIPEPLSRVTVPNVVYKPLSDCKMSSNLLMLSRHEETTGAVLAFLKLVHSSKMMG